MTQSKKWNALELSEDNLGPKSISDQLFDYQVDALKTLMDQQIIASFDKQILSSISIPPSSLKNYTITTDGTWVNRVPAPLVTLNDKEVRVDTPDGITESISREDLIKYIDERRLVQENEVVRKMYERYQVAVKLARSDNNGDTGE